MKKIILSIISILTISIGLNAQIVNIPDANFKAYLVGNSLINTNADSEIQVSEATAFSGTIHCTSLNISDLTGIEAFTNIIRIWCQDNALTSLDVSYNTALYELICHTNQLTSLDLSSNTALENLACSDNQITSLDISNTYMESLDCTYNALTYLNVANGNNMFGFYSFWAINNPNLTCIQVDDVAWSNTNWSSSVDATASFSLNCPPPCTVNIPDANFKAYLVGNAAINTNGNSEIECTEASTFTGQILCFNASISDLTGIEAFTAVTQLNFYNNSVTSVDLSQNTALTFLRCSDNDLTSLDVSQNTALNYLDLQGNSITSIDVSQNTALLTLDCQTNSLNSLDVTQNTALTSLECYSNSLTSLDVSQNTALTYLSCNNNSLISLDVSALVNLETLQVQNNDLTSLNVANGNNTIMNTSVFGFNTTGNPSLSCIEVDDVAYSTANWTNIDATSSFSTNCGGVTLVNSITVGTPGGTTTITTNGGTLQMTATVLPATADDVTYTWSVVNGTGSATIDANGLLTATGNGTVTVTATANDGSGETSSFEITISNQSVGINDLAFVDRSSIPIKITLPDSTSYPVSSLTTKQSRTHFAWLLTTNDAKKSAFTIYQTLKENQDDISFKFKPPELSGWQFAVAVSKDTIKGHAEVQRIETIVEAYVEEKLVGIKIHHPKKKFKVESSSTKTNKNLKLKIKNN